MLERTLRQIWDQLRGRKPQLRYFLDEVRIRNLRGIRDLRVPFSYPVSVLAGQNGCGKSTVLFAAACAYKVPDSGVKDFVPSALLPDFRPSQADLPRDSRSDVVLTYAYQHDGDRLAMQWARGETGWGRSYLGKKGGRQPQRHVYLRTLRNLSNPSEVRSVLQLGRSQLQQDEVDANLLSFAQQILPFRYTRLIRLSRPNKDLLYAIREDHGQYSEFHMSAGERAILRLSRDISQLKDALVLIDEIEAGLHPFVQQQLMLQLQRLALRNGLQIVVTTHSPAVLDAVPAEAKIFLERTAEDVLTRPAYRDILERAFYGRSFARLTVLCEDDIAEGMVRGVLDVLKPELSLLDEDIEVGRDSSKTEFASYVRSLAMVGQLENFLFVLDGDARQEEASIRAVAQRQGKFVNLFFLPGTATPEAWLWDSLKARTDKYAEDFGVPLPVLIQRLDDFERVYATAADSASNIAKERLFGLTDTLRRPAAEIARTIARQELVSRHSDLVGFKDQLIESIHAWRSLRGA